ncbi:MAG: NYN domain-containing protein [Gammaproteobacteria bacterium]
MVNRIALFADVQNLYYTTRQAYARQFNYRKLWQQVGAAGNIVLANAYAIDRADEQQRKFQAALRHVGFQVRLKPYIQRSDGSSKGDWDVGITIDVMQAAAEVDTVVLLSGDGDFSLLLDRIHQDYAVRTEVYGVPALTANALIRSAQVFHPIEDALLL